MTVTATVTIGATRVMAPTDPVVMGHPPTAGWAQDMVAWGRAMVAVSHHFAHRPRSAKAEGRHVNTFLVAVVFDGRVGGAR